MVNKLETFILNKQNYRIFEKHSYIKVKITYFQQCLATAVLLCRSYSANMARTITVKHVLFL